MDTRIDIKPNTIKPFDIANYHMDHISDKRRLRSGCGSVQHDRNHHFLWEKPMVPRCQLRPTKALVPLS